MITESFTFEKQQGLYHNKFNLSLTSIQRLGRQSGNCKMDYYDSLVTILLTKATWGRWTPLFCFPTGYYFGSFQSVIRLTSEFHRATIIKTICNTNLFHISRGIWIPTVYNCKKNFKCEIPSGIQGRVKFRITYFITYLVRRCNFQFVCHANVHVIMRLNGQ